MIQMKYGLISEKLLLLTKLENKRLITRDELKEYCKKLKISYYSVINYLLNYKYVTRILRGIFYINDLDERKKKTSDISFYKAICEALKIKGIKNWYFGLETAIKLNNLTHEYFAIDYILSDRIKRPKPIEILGHKVHFIKIKKKLTEFGIKNNEVSYSDIEKTILDIIYLGVYNGLSDSDIKNKIVDYADKCDNNKVIRYSKNYPKSVLRLYNDTKRNN